MGVKTEPMRNKKFSYSVIGTKMANTMPSTVRLIAVVFSDNFGKMLTKLTPAENASRYVVVTVAKIMINNGQRPSPVFNITAAMSVSPA